MSTMSRVESAFCRSVAWRPFTRRLALVWVLQGVTPSGHALHRAEGSDEHRTIGWDELAPVLDRLRLSDSRVRAGLGGVVVTARREGVR